MDHEEYPEIKIESGEDWITMTQEQFAKIASRTYMLLQYQIHERF